MLIRLDKTDQLDVRIALQEAFAESRFVCTIEERGKNLKLVKVRLRENRPYCGNHPSFCEVSIGRKPRSLPFLEGADWVAVNDLINDVLDSWGISANVASSVCVIRKGRERRLEYYGTDRQWQKDANFSAYGNYCGQQAPRSEYPSGTPGNSSYH